MTTRIILFVADQGSSKAFYEHVLDVHATLDVPGMTELPLGRDSFLGLMPLRGIARLLGDALIAPDAPAPPPRGELYISRADARACFDRALAAGATLVSAMAERNWGDVAGYVRDPDGHLLALATTADVIGSAE
jgi:catechol 2,3-dioxygenase-like lactoylglutathione lyase family enzyme